VELRHLRYFIAVAETLSFRAAASRLGIRQPNVSQRIGDLEDRLGVALFERHPGRGIQLTPTGRRFFRDARRVLFEANRAFENASRAGRAETGDLVLGFATSLNGVGLRTAIAGFRQLSPAIAVSFVEGNSIELKAGVVDRRVDVALIAHHSSDPRTGSLPLWSERLHVAMPEDHPLAQRDTIDWPSLADLPLVVRTWETASTAYNFVASRLRTDLRQPMITQHIVSPDSLIALSAVGFGLAIVLESAIGAQYSGVAFRPIAGPDALIPISVVWLSNIDNPVVGRFVGFLRDHMRRARSTSGEPAS